MIPMLEGRPPGQWRWLSWPFYLCFAAWVWLRVLRLPRVPPGVELDASWKQLVGLDFQTATQFGIDSVFTYGPLGYFVTSSPSYMPELFWQRVILDMILKAAIVIGVMAPVTLIRQVWQKLLYLLMLLLVAPISDDAFALMAIAGSAITLILKEKGLRWVVPAVVMYAVLGLGKFTFLTLAAGTVAMLMIGVWRRGGWRQGLAVPLSFLGAFVLVWIVIGQSPLNLLAYLKGSVEIASGYNQSMRLDDSPRGIVVPLVGVGLTLLAGLLALCSRPWQLNRVVALCIFAAIVFVGWKTGMVRQDTGHESIFYCCVILLPLWLLGIVRREQQSGALVCAVSLAMATGVVGALWTDDVARRQPVEVLRSQIADHEARWEFLTDPGQTRDRLDTELKRARIGQQLPAVKARIGEATVDQVPHQQAILFLNGLRVHHRPIFQSYSAYSPYLQNLNGEFFEDPRRAPAFTLLRINDIDRQFPTVSDSQVYRALLRHYTPVLAEGDYVLLERRTDANLPPVTGRPGGLLQFDRRLRLGEWVDLEPGEGLGELAVDLGFSPKGSCFNLLYRGPKLYLDVRLAGGSEIQGYVVSRGSIIQPFLVDPLVGDNDGFAQLYIDPAALSRVVAVRLRAAHGSLYDKTCRLRFWRSPFPTPPADAAREALRSHFSVSTRAPSRRDPIQNFSLLREDGRMIQVAHPPSAMHFDGLRGEVKLSGVFGIRAAAYEARNRTDGVTFRIEQRTPGGESRILFERRLEPDLRPEDRGPQSFAFDVTAPDGSDLVFRTLAGPELDWDWSYWTDLSFGEPIAQTLPRLALSADVEEISLKAGGVQNFSLSAGEGFAGLPYLLLGTTGGTQPGIDLSGMHIPLNLTGYTRLTLGCANTPTFTGFRGRLDREGRASAALHLPGTPSLDGAVRAGLHHVFAIHDGKGRILKVSNPVSLRLR